MRSRKLNRLLHTLYKRQASPPGPASDKLEAELLARHGQLYERKPKGWSMFLNPKFTTGRIILTSVAILALGIGACSVPSDIETEIGQMMELSLAAQVADDDFLIQEAVSYGKDLPGVENISINENISTGTKQVNILLWGEEMDGQAIEASMKSRFPKLADADVVIKPLEATVRGNLGERIGHAIFDLQITAEGSEEEFRQQILEQLAAQGFTGESLITIHEEDGQALIDIELTEESDD